MYYPRFTKVIIHYFFTKDKTISRRNKIGMHTSRDDYLINTLKFVSANEKSQIYGAQLPKSMTSPEMRETKAYKTYLVYAIGVTPPKKAQKFKKPASLKLTTVPVSPEEPTRKSKRFKRPANKSTNVPTVRVVIRDTPVMSLTKKKEKMTVKKCKGIDVLSEVALTEEAQYEEACKKSLREFHKTHPSGSGTVTKITPSAATNRGSRWSDFEHETDEKETDSKSDQEENEEEVKDDEEVNDDEFVKTSSNSTDDDETNVESKVEDKVEDDEDKGMDYTTNQFDDDVDVRRNEPVNIDEGFIQKEDIPHTDAEIVSPMDVHVHHELPSNQTPALLTDDLLNTQVTALVDEHLDSRPRATTDEFMSYLSASITVRITEQVKIQLPHILPKEVSNFAPLVIKSMVNESLEHAVLANDSSQPKSTYKKHKAILALGFEYCPLKLYQPLIGLRDLGLPAWHIHVGGGVYESEGFGWTWGSQRGLKVTGCGVGTLARKVKVCSCKRTEFEVVDSDMPQDQEENLGNDDEEPKRKVVSKRDWFTKPIQPKEPIDPDWNVGKTPQ
ncbi:hypothetical protein Tco_1303369 [Tanacetum coccineum]